MDNTIICPGCGWSGSRNDLGKWGDCPACQYEYSDGPLPSINSMMTDNTLFNDVRLDLFLKAFLKAFIRLSTENLLLSTDEGQLSTAPKNCRQ